MAESARHSVSVAAAVMSEDGRVLAIRRRDNGHWEPPGGILEIDETITEGLIREVLEETGVTVEIDRLSGVYKNMTKGIVALVFRCHPAGGAAGSTPEASEVAWLTGDEVRERMDEAFAIRLLDAMEISGLAPAVRVHDGTKLLSSATV
jgi:8-oxo-dGTP diphosphatase